MSIREPNASAAAQATIETSWQEIERITASMRDAAAQKSWHDVVEWAASRHHNLLRHFDAFPVGPQNALFYRERLTQMIAGEQSLHALAVDARREIMRESATASYNHRAVNAYLS